MLRKMLLTVAAVLVPCALLAFDLRPQVDPLARDLLAAKAAVGVAVGILKDGETQVLGYGEVSRGSGKRPDGDTVYEIGSVTKTFTGILVAGQVLRGQVDLRAPVQTYLPPTVRMPTVAGGPVTMRHLLTHTGGYPSRPDNLRAPDDANRYSQYTEAAMVSFLNGYQPRFPLGSYNYSNFGMGVAGYVAQQQTGLSYDGLLAERITGPLGMRDTAHAPTPAMLQRLAPPYGKGLAPVNSWDFSPVLAGAGGMRSTVHDLLKYARANLAPDATPLGQAIALSHKRQGTRDGGKPIALGWRISANRHTLTHTGRTNGYRAWLAVVPGRQLAVVVLGNGPSFKVVEFGDKVTLAALRTLKGGAGGSAPGGEEPEGDREESSDEG